MLHYQGDGHFIHLPNMKTKTTKAKAFQRSPHVYNHLKIMIRHLAKTYKKQYFSGVLGIEQFELGHHNGGSQDNSRIMCVHN